METLKVILAWVLVFLIMPLWVTFVIIETLLFVNNDVTKDIEISNKIVEGFVSAKILNWFLNKMGL